MSSSTRFAIRMVGGSLGILAIWLVGWGWETFLHGAEETRPASPPQSTASAGAEQKVLRAGIIGLTTSHVIAFSNLINDPKATGPMAQVEIVAGFPGGVKDNPSSWDRWPQYTEELRKKGVRIYESIPEMLRDVDVVLLEEVDGRPHLEWARPVIEARKPLFIDKPLAGSLADCIEIFQLAKEKGVP